PIDNHLVVLWNLTPFWAFRRCHWSVRIWRVDLNGLTVKLRIGKVACGASKIDEREVELPGVLVDPSTPAHDLLEFRHGTDRAINGNETAGLDVHAGRKQPRRGHNDRVLGFRVDEVAKLGLAKRIAARNTHNVPVILGAEVRVLVDERLTHAGRVFLVNA